VSSVVPGAATLSEVGDLVRGRSVGAKRGDNRSTLRKAMPGLTIQGELLSWGLMRRQIAMGGVGVHECLGLGLKRHRFVHHLEAP